VTPGRRLLFALLAVGLVLGGLEAALRLAGFEYRRVTTDLEFTYPRPGLMKAFFELDPDLLYRIRSTVKQRWVDLTWQPAFDLKIRDARVFGPKPPGVLRILALGDSSTYGVNSEHPWPAQLQERLDRRFGAGRFEVINLGVPGYTSLQGRRLLETRGARLQPDLVVVYFGWNDHLLALGRADAEQTVGPRAAVAARDRLGASRVYQAVSWCVAHLRRETVPSDPSLRRVGPDAFAANLASIAATAGQLGARTLLCTYPTSLESMVRAHRAAPDWLVETHLGRGHIEDVLKLQEDYNTLVRAAAAHDVGRLVDLDAAFEREGRESLYDDPLAGDLIHPNTRGYTLIAGLVEEAVIGEGKVTAAPAAAAQPAVP
jgi:lysophospholipase L1-like esterase